VSRGRYWGLIFQVKPQNWKWERLDIGISGFFPAFGVPSTPANRFEKALENLPPVLKFAAHRLGVVMLAVYVAVILPLTVIYRLALLKLQPSIQSAYGYLEAVWPQIQASYPGLLNLQRRRSPAAMFALGAVAAVGVACVCFVILSDPSREWSTLHFLSGIAGVLAALTLIILSVQRLLTSDTGL
jgi:peptidoglycan/LPS O-acetylase OafA/YrhL